MTASEHARNVLVGLVVFNLFQVGCEFSAGSIVNYESRIFHSAIASVLLGATLLTIHRLRASQPGRSTTKGILSRVLVAILAVFTAFLGLILLMSFQF